MVIFENEGLIDIEVIKTMGVSVKENKNPIGFFGTGLKYAIATLLRYNCKIILYIGTSRYPISTIQSFIRNKPFTFPCIQGQILTFTTELGKTWELWMAYRELACNAFDEGGKVHINETYLPEEGKTAFLVKNTDFQRIHTQRKSFLIPPDMDPVHADNFCEFYPTNSREFMFYRGIRAGIEEKPSMFRYNIIKEVELTEDRTIKYNFQAQDIIAQSWVTCENKELLNRLLFNLHPQAFEANFDWMTCGSDPSEAFLDVVNEAAKAGKFIPPKIDRLFQTHRKKSAVLPEDSIQLNGMQQEEFDKAIALLVDAGFDVDQFKTIITDRLGPGILGRAVGNTIYISSEAFRKGDNTLIGTLLEEWLHITRGVLDNSTNMQNWLVDALATQIKTSAYYKRELETALGKKQ